MQGFEKLREYKAEHGDVLVPRRYKTSGGYNLGIWVRSQRVAKAQGKLSPDQIEQLEGLGFVWDVLNHLWVQGFEELLAYKAEHGDILMPHRYQTIGRFKLGGWVSAQRVAKAQGRMSPDQIEQLEGLGFVWDVLNHLWVQGFEELLAYKAEHGDVLVPHRYQTIGRFKLGRWVSTQRVAKAQGRMSPDQIERLEGLGFVWDVLNHLWVHGFEELLAYKAEHGDILVPQRYQTIGRFKLGGWVSAQRVAKAQGRMSPDQIEQLEGLGFVWDVLNHLWVQGFEELLAYKAEHGDVLVPQRYQTIGRFKLGSWVHSQRIAKAQGRMSPDQIERLEGVGFVWNVRSHLRVQRLESSGHTKAEHGEVLVPQRKQTAAGYNLHII